MYSAEKIGDNVSVFNMQINEGHTVMNSEYNYIFLTRLLLKSFCSFFLEIIENSVIMKVFMLKPFNVYTCMNIFLVESYNFYNDSDDTIIFVR